MDNQMDPELHKRLLVEQYRIAVKYNRWDWVLDVQSGVEFLLDPQWILDNLSHRDRRRNRVRVASRRVVSTEYSSSVRDFRLNDPVWTSSPGCSLDSIWSPVLDADIGLP